MVTSVGSLFQYISIGDDIPLGGRWCARLGGEGVAGERKREEIQAQEEKEMARRKGGIGDV